MKHMGYDIDIWLVVSTPPKILVSWDDIDYVQYMEK